jgi:hypothetical protein
MLILYAFSNQISRRRQELAILLFSLLNFLFHSSTVVSAFMGVADLLLPLLLCKHLYNSDYYYSLKLKLVLLLRFGWGS